jgi:hypothetical protein
VARRLGFAWKESLTLGKAVAGLNAQSKGRRLGIFRPAEVKARKRKGELRAGAKLHVDLLGRAVPVRQTEDGLRALNKERITTPESVERYLDAKFGDALGDAREAMEALAKSRRPTDLAEEAFDLYASFRPSIPSGRKGWGAKGVLDLRRIRRMAGG